MKKEVKIGLAGIASLLILFFGINYLKGVNMFKPKKRISSEAIPAKPIFTSFFMS